MMSVPDYYVLIGDQEEGPFALEQLRVMLRNGEITSTTLAAAPGFENWIEVQYLLKVHAPAPDWKKKELDDGLGLPKGAGPVMASLVTAGLVLFLIASFSADGWGLVAILLLSLGGLGVYFLPTILAAIGRNRNIVAIVALNFLLGWTILGWVGALVWALYVEKDEITEGRKGREAR